MRWLLCLCLSFITCIHAEFKAEVKTVAVGDIQMAYYIRGEGKPLLLINGYISSMSLWDPALLDELAKNYQLILFDNRGVGLSTDTAENKTTIEQMSDDAAGLIKALGYEKVNILAWSMGARIGQQLLIRNPELVDKAILCSANPGGKYEIQADRNVENKLNDPNIPDMEKIGLVFTNDEKGKIAAKNTLTRLKEAVAKGIIPNDFKIAQETLLRQNRARTTLWSSNNANYEALKNIKNPVLVADGRFDIIDVPKNSALIASQIPYAWVAYLDGGHAFLFQEYKQFADIVHAFLQ